MAAWGALPRRRFADEALSSFEVVHVDQAESSRSQNRWGQPPASSKPASRACDSHGTAIAIIRLGRLVGYDARKKEKLKLDLHWRRPLCAPTLAPCRTGPLSGSLGPAHF